MERIGNILPDRKEGIEKLRDYRPRYTVVLHAVRHELALSVTHYCVIDSIHKLSRMHESHLWCTMSKDNMAAFLGLSRRTVFNAIAEGLRKGIIEKNDRGDLRTSEKWMRLVEIYDIREAKKRR